MRRRRNASSLLIVSGLFAAAALVMACGADATTPSPAPTIVPTIAPIATPTSLPAGPLNGTGPLARGIYETPADFSPAFSFDLRSDAWVSATPPDAFGFALATPTLARLHAIIALARPQSTTVAAFEQELAGHGLLAASGPDPAATVTDLSVGGAVARQFAVTRSTAVDAFGVLNPTGSNLTGLGGQLPVNQVIYITTSSGPIVLVLSHDGEGAAEVRFVFDAIVRSVAFK